LGPTEQPASHSAAPHSATIVAMAAPSAGMERTLFIGSWRFRLELSRELAGPVPWNRVYYRRRNRTRRDPAALQRCCRNRVQWRYASTESYYLSPPPRP